MTDIINYYEEITQNQLNNATIKRRRGRPRKNQIIKSADKNFRPKNDDQQVLSRQSEEEEEIVLHLQLDMSDIQKLDEKDKVQEMEKKADNIFTITDLSYDSISDEKSHTYYINRIKDLEEVVLKLQEELSKGKSCTHAQTSLQEEQLLPGNSKVHKMDIEFIKINNNEQEVLESTHISCWWCTYQFNSVPCFIPERYYDNKYHVFGCFCSYNCAAAYNFSLNDYNVWNRYSLIKKLNNIVFNNKDDIILAPKKEVLEKYGGPVSIDDYRKNFTSCKKDYRFIMPPMVSIIPLIEECSKDSVKYNKVANNSENLVLKRSKPLPNSKNTLIETFSIVKKK